MFQNWDEDGEVDGEHLTKHKNTGFTFDEIRPKAQKEQNDRPFGFPLARGRGKGNVSPEHASEQPKPRGLADKKRSRHVQGFGYAVKELKQFQDRNSATISRKYNTVSKMFARTNNSHFHINSEESGEKTTRMVSPDEWVLDDEPKRQLTSTPTVTRLNSFTNRGGEVGDNNGSPTGSFLDVEINEMPDSQIEISTLNKGHLMSDRSSSGMSRSTSSGVLLCDSMMQEDVLKRNSTIINEIPQNKSDGSTDDIQIMYFGQNTPDESQSSQPEHVQYDKKGTQMSECKKCYNFMKLDFQE